MNGWVMEVVMISNERTIHEALRLRKQCRKLHHGVEDQDVLLLLHEVSFVILQIII